MAVTTSVLLPNQPAAGSTIFVPYGGNGTQSPTSAYAVRIDSTGDASGGDQQVIITPDPQFTSVVSYMHAVVIGATANVPVRIGINPDDPANSNVFGNATYANVGLGASSARAGIFYTPPPMLLVGRDHPVEAGDQPQLHVTFANQNGREVRLYALIYNFLRDVAQTTPLNEIFSCLARGAGSL